MTQSFPWYGKIGCSIRFEEGMYRSHQNSATAESHPPLTSSIR